MRSALAVSPESAAGRAGQIGRPASADLSQADRRGSIATRRPGDLVEVRDGDGELAGYGLYNPKSELALRMLSRAERAAG